MQKAKGMHPISIRKTMEDCILFFFGKFSPVWIQLLVLEQGVVFIGGHVIHGIVVLLGLTKIDTIRL